MYECIGYGYTVHISYYWTIEWFVLYTFTEHSKKKNKIKIVHSQTYMHTHTLYTSIHSTHAGARSNSQIKYKYRIPAIAIATAAAAHEFARTCYILLVFVYYSIQHFFFNGFSAFITLNHTVIVASKKNCVSACFLWIAHLQKKARTSAMSASERWKCSRANIR